nr:sigma factor-like helix-turn-helix DNA-binding protein [Acidithiobacillus ferrooxidans]
MRRWYFFCVCDAITHDLLSPYPGRPFCTSEKSGIQRRSVTAYFSAIGKELGVSHERVRQLQEEALELLRHYTELQ